MAKNKNANAKCAGKRIPKTFVGLTDSKEQITSMSKVQTRKVGVADGKVSVALGRTKRTLKSNSRYVDNDSDESVKEKSSKVTKNPTTAEVKVTAIMVKNNMKEADAKVERSGKSKLSSNTDDTVAPKNGILNEKGKQPDRKNEMVGSALGLTKEREIVGAVTKKKKIREVKRKYAIDFTDMSQIVDVVELAQYLRKNIKVEGKKNNFGKTVSVKEKHMKVYVKSSMLKKKDVKYWTNK